ncbi:hypothetical protein [Streptomyces sp. NPDC054987]
MAGESPDKSVDEETPGAAESSAERDPRLSVFRPRASEDGPVVTRGGDSGAGAGARADGDVDSAEAEAEAEAGAGVAGADAEAEAGGRDALREAVAAWVATTEEPASGSTGADAADTDGSPADADTGSAGAGRASGEVAERPASAGSKPAAAGSAAGERPGSASGESKSADGGSGSGSGEGKSAAADGVRSDAGAAASSAADSASGESKPAAAGSVAGERAGSAAARANGSASGAAKSAVADGARSGSADAGESSGEADGGPAEARVAGSGSGEGDVDGDRPGSGGLGSGGAGRASGDGSASGEGKSAVEDSERTAVFRAVKPGSAGTGSPKPAEAPADESADSERTAVFRAVKPDSAGTGSGSGAGEAKSRGVRLPKGPAPAAPSKPAAEEPVDSERTAVFRVPKVDALKPDSGDKQKPKPAAARPASPSASASTEDSERTAVFRAPKPAAPRPDAPKASTFVPLRADGGAAPKAPVPPAPPAKASAATTTERFDHSDRSERTTQQPLPPKPPLDMLADLTNNPPPPPSPLRTAVRRIKIYAPLVVLLAVILSVVQLVRPLPEPKLVMTAKSSYTFEGAAPQLPWPTEGQAYMAAAGLGTLGQSGEQKPVPIASVTKSMTAYIILRDHPIKKGEQGAMIDVDKTAETEGKKNDSVNNESTLDTVKEGDKISEYDAIAALMIPSANNIARLLARWDSGSQEAFVKKMNDTAKELGMTNTTYTDPSGLDATTVSTAEDQVKLGLKLVEIETLLDITKKPFWVDPSGKNWRNWNGLTGPSGALGIKTGTTTKAGGNLLFAAQKKIGNTNQLIVGAVLGQHKPAIIDTVLAASKQLMTATQKALDGAVVVKKGQVVGYVDDGLGGRTPVVATADVQAIGWASLTVDVKLADGGSKVPQTAKAGTEVGLLTVGEGASQVKVPVALQSDLASPGIGSKLTRIG